MCYVPVLMLVNLLSLLKRNVLSHRLLRPMGGWRCPEAASEPMVGACLFVIGPLCRRRTNGCGGCGGRWRLVGLLQN